MTPRVLLFLLLSTLTTPALAALTEYRAAVNAETSLISLYTFEAGDAADSKGTNNGTLQGTGTTFTTGAGGGTDKALTLNGAGRVNLGTLTSLQFTDGTGTAEAWVQAGWGTITYNPCLFANREGGSTRWSIHMGLGKTEYGVWNGSSYQPQAIANAGTSWHHVAVVWNGASTLLYWDGVLIGTKTQGMGNTGLPTQLGSSSAGSTVEGWNGKLDEVAFYSDALSASAIATHYNAFLFGAGPRITTQPSGGFADAGRSVQFTVGTTNPAGLTYQWRRNTADIPGATSATYTLDPVTPADNGVAFDCVVSNDSGSSTSNAATLTVVNSGYYASAVNTEPSLLAYFPVDGSTAPAVANVKNPAFSGTLNGTATHETNGSRVIGTKGIGNTGTGWVSLTKDAGWDFTDGNGTVELFAYQPAAVSNYNPTLFSLRADPGVRYSFHTDSQGNLIYFWNGGAVQTWTLPSSGLGRLMHLVFVMEGGQCTCYHNGVSLGTVAIDLGSSLNLPAQIGAAGPSTQEAFVGTVDDVALYGDPLPASAVAAHYAAWRSATSGAAPVIATQPASLSVSEGGSATFSVALEDAAGAIYRWQKNGVDIPGATGATYNLPAVTLADHDARFQAIIYNAHGGTFSTVATLNVADHTAPQLLSASAPISATQVLLVFNEPVNPAGATFTLTGGGTVTSVTQGPVPGVLLLTVTGLTPGASYTLTATNVTDAAGNVLASGDSGFTAVPPPVPAPLELVRPVPETAGPATRRGPFVISEMNYHPPTRTDGKNLEFIEIYNSQPWAENLADFRLTGEVTYRFPAGTTIPAGGYVVVAAVPADVQSAYGITGVLGPWTGALNNTGGEVRLRDRSNAVVFTVTYDPTPPWPAAADGSGHTLVLSRPSYGMEDPRAWDFSVNPGGSPGSPEPALPGALRSVVVNEVLHAQDGVELYNYSAAAVDISGCTLSDDKDGGKYTFPAGTVIQPLGFLSVVQPTLGFGLKAGGDTAYFRAPGDGTNPGRVLDAVRYGAMTPTSSWGRYPDGGMIFSVLSKGSPGAPNDAPAAREAVFSEISYHPPTGSSQPPFVEIANPNNTPLDLTGWRIRGGVDYSFPAGTILPANGYLTVTAFSGTLSQGTGERLRLQKPVANLNGTVQETIYPVVDEVTYGTAGRWGRWSDGGGSSLERRDLLSDGRLAGNWADSEESGESGWVTIENTGIPDNGSGAPVNRLHIMMLGEGECLVDDVEVTPAGGSNLITNGGFETGGGNWIISGTHGASSLEDTGATGSGSLHVRAAGRGDLAGNRISVALNSTPAANVACTIRAKVKWLRGHPEILFRLNGGNLEATGNILSNTVIPGTPGAVNSRAAGNTGPAISGVTHRPVLPQAGETATVYARLDDPDGVSFALLNYRIDPSPTQASVVMSYRGAGLFSAEIPAQSAGKLAAFSITAYDSAGVISMFPSDAPVHEGLIRWGEPASTDTLGSYRFWMTEATRSLWAGRMKNDNTPLDVTFIYGNSRVIYNATSQFSGSPFHTPGFNGPTGAACDYDCSVPGDDRFLGEKDFILAGPGTYGSDTSFIREQTIWWIAREIALPSIHRRFCRVYVNGAQRQTVFEDTQQPNGAWINEYWPGDNDGSLRKAQDWIEFADNGTTFQTDIRAAFAKRTTTGGAHKNAFYRYQWATRAVSDSANDWADFDALINAHNTGTSATDPAYAAALDPLVDEDSWARALAVQRISGNWDSWGWSYGKNMYMYKPKSGPWYMTAWDMDFSFGPDGSANPAPDPATSGLFQNTSAYDGGSLGDPLATKFRTQPTFRRAYWRAFLDAVDGPMNTAAVNARIDAMTAGLAANGITANAAQVTAVKNYISARRTYILGQLNTAFGATTFTLTGGGTITDADGVLTLTGTAPAGVSVLRINGVSYTPVWTSETAWSLPLTLYSQTNSFNLEALGRAGTVLASVPVTITVTGPPPLPAVRVNEWMADNTAASGITDPVDGDAEDWFELYNAGTTPVNLGGFFLTDTTANPTQFTIPAGTVIPAGGYLLVWADGEADQNATANGQLHVNFKLSAAGESIGLYTPDGTRVDLVTFGPQLPDAAQGRYPDGADGIVLPVATPGKRNVLPPAVISLTRAGNNTDIVFSTEPTYSYQVEGSDDLLTWTAAGVARTATGSTMTVNLPSAAAGRKFWRARLVPAP